MTGDEPVMPYEEAAQLVFQIAAATMAGKPMPPLPSGLMPRKAAAEGMQRYARALCEKRDRAAVRISGDLEFQERLRCEVDLILAPLVKKLEDIFEDRLL